MSKCRNCVAYVFKKNKSVQSASYLFILLDVPIEIHNECKAFIEIWSPTDFLIWVFLCHFSFGYEPTWHVTASAGRCVWFQTWEMKIAAKHLSWVGLHLLLMRSLIYKVICQEISCKDVSFTDGNIHSLLYIILQNDGYFKHYMWVWVCCEYTLLSRFHGHRKNINCSEILMKILVLENCFCSV